MMKAVIIDGKKVAQELCNELTSRIIAFDKEYKVAPCLAVVLVGDDPASHIYVKNKIKKGREIGIKVLDFILPANTTPQTLKAKLEDLNQNKFVHGILVQLPLPEHINQNEIINMIDPRKDVDGFTVMNIGLLNSWQDCLEPSTPQAVLRIIKQTVGEDLSGKKVVILGRSLIVGRPLSTILIRESCTVTLLHSKSVNIKEECTRADILVSAIGHPGYITSDLVKDGACVIDVGITRVDDKIYGDVDFASVSQVAGLITPVPGGVGPMTVACMLANTVKAAYQQAA